MNIDASEIDFSDDHQNCTKCNQSFRSIRRLLPLASFCYLKKEKAFLDGHSEPKERRLLDKGRRDEKRSQDIEPKYVFWCCLVSTIGGGLHGFHNAIVGTILNRKDFLKSFFPDTLVQPTSTSIYCQYSNSRIAFLTSSLFLTSIVVEGSGFPAYMNRRYGRTRLMIISGALFTLSSIIFTVAQTYEMLILSRCISGGALSFATVSILLQNSEISTVGQRGKNSQLFALQITAGIFFATVGSLCTDTMNGGWRLVSGLAIIPSILFAIAGIWMPDSPCSLIERGLLDQGYSSLLKYRKVSDLDVELADNPIKSEYNQMSHAGEIARKCKSPWRIILKRSRRPSLCLSMFSTLFQQFTGINFVIFYGSTLFQVLGQKRRTVLWITVSITFLNHISTYISYFAADHIGRIPLLKIGGIQMILGQLSIGFFLLFFSDKTRLPWIIFVFVCVFDMGYAYSWGSIGWSYPTEISDLATRSAGITVSSWVNVFFSFIVAQFSLAVLCQFQAGLFLFFAVCISTITVTVHYLFPETRNAPIEKSCELYLHHKIWSKYVNEHLCQTDYIPISPK